MLIISKFHDYYDKASGFGIDKAWVYERHTSGTENKHRYLDQPDAFTRDHIFVTDPVVIGFVGDLYPLLRVHKTKKRFQEWEEKEETEGIYDAETDLDFGNPIWKRGVMPLEFYASNGYEYVITASEDYNRYLEGSSRYSFPSTHAFYRDLFDRGILVKGFGPDVRGGRGPVIKVFKLEAYL